MWKWFQKAKNNIDTWGFSDEMKVVVQKINDEIPPLLRKALIAYIKTQYDKSEQIAMASLEQLKIKFNEII